GQSIQTPRVQSVDAIDQWTVQGPLRNLRPLWKFSWPDGQQVYVAQPTGEVVQYTTTASRIGAYLGPIPHWLYFTPLRQRQLAWTRVVVWSSGIATVAAAIGLVIALWVSLPLKRIPYRGQKRWHTIFGLMFGVSVMTWAFSGMLSMEPFPTERSPAPPPFRLRSAPAVDAFATRDPRDAIRALAPRRVKELELTSMMGEPTVVATLDGGVIETIPSLDSTRLNSAVTVAGATATTIDDYDAYYRDRRRERPLPVMLAQLHEPLAVSRPPFARLPVALQSPAAVGRRRDRLHARRHGAQRHVGDPGVARRYSTIVIWIASCAFHAATIVFPLDATAG